MSDLIDRKQIAAYIADQSYLWDDYDIDQVLEDIQSAPAVEAIPVEWIRLYMLGHPHTEHFAEMLWRWAERKEG